MFRNFFGVDYTESEFIDRMKNGDIAVYKFEISNIEYDADLMDPTLATVTMNVHIEATVNGTDQNSDLILTHKVKQGWQTYESTLSAPPE